MFFVSLLVRRLAFALLTLFLVAVIVFLSMELIPGDAATRYLGRDATPEALVRLRAQLGLDEPLLARFGVWLGGLATLDFGTSLASGRPVIDVLGTRLMNSLQLSVFALLLYVPLVIVPALASAVFQGRTADNLISGVNLLIASIPPFLLATFILLAFAVFLPVAPVLSSVDATMTVFERLDAMLLPALTLGLTMAAYTLRILRDNLIDILRTDYVRMAELKGLSRMQVLLFHAVPNAIGPSLHLTALNIAFLVSGVVVVEKVFAFPGFGTALVDALLIEDQPVAVAAIIIAAAAFILANVVADIGSIVFNPRLRGH